MNKIKLQNISKTFGGNYLGRELALSHITNIFFKKRIKNKTAVLDDVSFDVNSGEVLGIIGKNGSGKSSLLRIMAGIYKADSGKVISNGEIFYLTTMGVGLMDRLTMKENIFLVGAIMGLTRKEVKEIFNDIVEFSELGEFVNSKVKYFSTGMIGRLGFSISAFCMKSKKSEILLLDEVFGSGADFQFEQKAIKKMEEFINGGATIVMVSHDLEIIEKYCNKVILLEQGKIKSVGMPREIIELYKKN